MNAKDLITLLEYKQTFDKPDRRWKKPKEKKFDIVALLREKKEEAELLEKFLKEQEKIHKKEDKKAEGHKLTFSEGMLIAFMLQFIAGPLYKVALVHLGVQ